MHSDLFRYIRYLLAVFTLFIFSFIFLDFRNAVPAGWFNTFTWLQFGPSLVRFMKSLAPASLGFAAVIALTLLFGRFYCSALCPLGVMQDLVIWIRKQVNSQKLKFRYKKPLWWRWVFMGIAIAALVLGLTVIYGLLDPFSHFGRIFSDLGKPALISINNLMGTAGDKTGLLNVNRFPLRGFNVVNLVFPMAVLVLIIALSWKRGRLFCNLICPVGALLGLFSKYSLFRIVLDKSKCNQCGLCQAECKAECINIRTQSIDYSRCVMCFDCIGPCPDKGVKLVLPGSAGFIHSEKDTGNHVSQSKRNLLGTALLLGLTSKIASQPDSKNREVFEKPTRLPERKDCAVSPPGSASVSDFNDKCIACHLCISACPTQVLQPSLLQYGLQGVLQPHMDYHANFCNFECVICSQVCPTSAIQPLTIAAKKKLQLGKTTFVKENCVVYTYNTACGACSEHCPTKAVHMVPYLNNLTIPEVDQAICVGCGACEYACPTKPYKAIYVNGNPVHLEALPPKQEKLNREAETEEWAF